MTFNAFMLGVGLIISSVSIWAIAGVLRAPGERLPTRLKRVVLGRGRAATSAEGEMR